jgi:hypothetical protein
MTLPRSKVWKKLDSTPPNIWKRTWEQGCRCSVVRRGPDDPKLELLDPGVRWFVLALESLGATTEFSCDGHGTIEDWYIIFHAPYKLAVRIAQRHYLTVEVWTPPGRKPCWDLRFPAWLWRKPPKGCTSWAKVYAMHGKDFWSGVQHEAAETWRKEFP